MIGEEGDGLSGGGRRGLNQRAGIHKSGGHNAVVGRADLRVVQHAGQLIQRMLGALIVGLRHIHILFGNDVRVFLPHIGESLIRDLFNCIVRLRLTVALKQFRVIDHRKHLACFDGSPLST